MLNRLTPYALTLALLTILPVSATAQAPSPDLVITNARLFDGTGQTIEDATIALASGRIQSVADGDAAPQGATVIDAAGKTVLPGLIDTHVHLLLREGSPLQLSSDSAMTARIEREVPSELRTYLQEGITAVLSPGDSWPHIRKVRSRLDAEALRGPRLLTAGPVFTAPGGHPAATMCAGGTAEQNRWCREHGTRTVSTEQEARQAVTQLTNRGVDAIKMVYDDTSPPAPEKLKPELVGVIAEAAHHNGRQVYAHVYTTADAIHSVESGVDRLAHTPSFESKPGQWQDLLDVMRAEDVTASSTLVIADELARRFAAAGDSASSRHLSRVRDGAQHVISMMAEQDADLIALGTDAPALPAGEAFHREVELLYDAGLRPRQIIQAATRNAAAHMGRAEDLGTVEPGKIADLVIVDGNPLDDLSALQNVAVVVKGGEVVVDHRDE